MKHLRMLSIAVCALAVSACDDASILDPTVQQGVNGAVVRAQTAQGEVGKPHFPSSSKEIVFADDRFEFDRQGEFVECSGKKSACNRQIYLIRDKATGDTFLAVSGIGIQALRPVPTPAASAGDIY